MTQLSHSMTPSGSADGRNEPALFRSARFAVALVTSSAALLVLPAIAMATAASPAARKTAAPPQSESQAQPGGDAGEAPAPPAQEPPQVDTRWAISGALGYSSNDVGFGFGLRGGKTLEQRIYIGGAVVYNLGTSRSVVYAPPLGGASVQETESSSLFYVGAEGGYDFLVGPVVIRPYLGLGLAVLRSRTAENGVTAVSSSDTRFIAWPGGAVIWDLPQSIWFIGGDLHILLGYPSATPVGAAFVGGLHF